MNHPSAQGGVRPRKVSGPPGCDAFTASIARPQPGGQDSDAADSQAVMRLFAWFNIARIRDLRRRDGIGRWVALPSGS
jgi:hypothetical protein